LRKRALAKTETKAFPAFREKVIALLAHTATVTKLTWKVRKANAAAFTTAKCISAWCEEKG